MEGKLKSKSLKKQILELEEKVQGKKSELESAKMNKKRETELQEEIENLEAELEDLMEK